jgi:hypothetical protein
MATLKRRCLLVLCAGALSLIAQAQSSRVAQLSDLSGQVLINRGERFIKAQPGMLLRSGDRVLTLDYAGARIIYDAPRSGCEVELSANSEALITDGTDCKRGVISAPDPAKPGVDKTVTDTAPAAWLQADPSVTCTLFDCLPSGVADNAVPPESP